MTPNIKKEICVRFAAWSQHNEDRASANSLKSKKENGQGFVEFALVLVFLLFLLSTMVDLGYAFYTLVSLRDTVQEAATYGAICPTMQDGTRNVNLIQQRVRSSATEPLNMEDININDITVEFADRNGATITPPGAPVLGGSVIVSATIEHEILVPLVGAVIGRDTYPLTVTVADTVIHNLWLSQCDY